MSEIILRGHNTQIKKKEIIHDQISSLYNVDYDDIFVLQTIWVSRLYAYGLERMVYTHTVQLYQYSQTV